MYTEIEAAGALLASCAFIILVTCSLQNIKAWGQTTRFGMIPVGILLGATSVAQMIHPIEPFDGFIFDLRNIPLALAGAFVGWRAALVAAAIAASVRFGIGGTGMIPGMIAIFWAASVGQIWQELRSRTAFRPSVDYLLLGLMTSTTLLVGFMVPEPVRTWFFLNAAPVLLVIYLTVVPGLAWIADNGFFLDTAKRRAEREDLNRHGLELLPLPSFLHQMRLDAMLGSQSPTHAVLCLQVESLSELRGHASRTKSEAVLEAVLLRLSDAIPKMNLAGILNDDTLLIPINEHQLQQLEQIKDSVREALLTSPLILPGHYRHWISYNLGVLSPNAFDQDLRLVPRAISTCQIFDSHSPPARPSPMRTTARGQMTKRFEPFEDADMLFLKARYLMKSSA